MPELKVEEAKKDLQGMVDKAKSSVQKAKETQMPEVEKKVLDEKRKKEQEEKVRQEEQKKKDTDILAKKDEERTPEEKERAKVLIEEQKKKDEDAKKIEEDKLSGDEKIKRIKEKSEKRIAEIGNELLQIKDKSSKEAQELRLELEKLRKDNEDLNKKISSLEKKEDMGSFIREQEQKIITKYIEEDKEKPKEQRREMSKEELETWLAEDFAAANEWLSERAVRRAEERKEIGRIVGFRKRQNESAKKTLKDHPELDVSKREVELKAEGKSPTEIKDILCKENVKYKTCLEIIQEKPELFEEDNGPELVIAEMEKRLAKKPDNQSPDPKDKEIEDLRKRVEDLEAEKQAKETTDVGINSNIPKQKKNEAGLTEAEQNLVDTLKSMKTPQANIDSALKKFREKNKAR